MLELILMRPIVSSLLGCHVDVYFGSEKIKDVTSFYSEIRNQIDVWLLCMYQKVLNLSEQNKEYRATYFHKWKSSVSISLLEICFRSDKGPFSVDTADPPQ